MKAQGESQKVTVYLFGGLLIILIITTTWLLDDNAFLQPKHECSVVTTHLSTKPHSTNRQHYLLVTLAY